MLKSRETLIQDAKNAIKEPKQLAMVLDLIDSAWQWRTGGAQEATRERWVTVGGQTKKGSTTDEAGPKTQDGGQTSVPVVGTAGPQGERGPAGAAGPAGAIGPAGATGATGPAGADGKDGADGAPGSVGAEGPAGPIGPAGPTINHDLLPGLNAGDYQHLTAAQKTDLTDGGDSPLHFHSADRARANHTGTQLASTISDFASAADARIAAQKGMASGIAPLGSDSKIPLTYLPATTIVDTFVVASQAAMLALTAQQGDVAVRTDLSKTFILKADPAGTLANWQEMLSPTDGVQSVGLTAPALMTSTGGPVTSTGTLALAWNGSSANLVRADGSTVASSSFQPSGSYQPLDADLTAIAALTTQTFGRSLLTAVDAAAGRTLLSAQVAGSYQAGSSVLTSIAAQSSGTGLLRLAAGVASLDTTAYQPVSGMSSYLTTAAAVTTYLAIGANAVSASKLQTARTIAGVSFDGSANISIPYANLTGLPTLGTLAAKSSLAISDITSLQTTLDGKQAAGSYVLTSDSRLSDARTPLAHNHDASYQPIENQRLSTSNEVSFSGLKLGYYDTSYSGIWHTSVTKSVNNWAFLTDSANIRTYLNASTSLELQIFNGTIRNTRLQVTNTNINCSAHLLGSTSYNIGASSNCWGNGYFNNLYAQNNLVWHAGNFVGTRNEHNHAGVYLPLAGGTMGGDINLGGYTITSGSTGLGNGMVSSIGGNFHNLQVVSLLAATGGTRINLGTNLIPTTDSGVQLGQPDKRFIATFSLYSYLSYLDASVEVAGPVMRWKDRIVIGNGGVLPIVGDGCAIVAVGQGTGGVTNKPTTNNYQSVDYRKADGTLATAAAGGNVIDLDLYGRCAFVVGVSSSRAQMIL